MNKKKEQTLKTILRLKEKELKILKQKLPLIELKKLVNLIRTRSKNFFLRNLIKKSNASTFSVISEVKRKSPSKGTLNENLNLVKQAQIYEKAGVAAISVLTEKNFFAGSIQDLRTVKKVVKIPVLRKDFIFDEYQIWESKLARADAILLIMSCLETKQAKELIRISRALNLDVLLEIHSPEEAERSIKLNPEIIGVNNRNLSNLQIDLKTSFQLIKDFRKNFRSKVWVSESGLSSQEQLKLLSKEGFNSFLIGESILKQKSPDNFLKELLHKK